MNARVTEPKPGEATPVTILRADRAPQQTPEPATSPQAPVAPQQPSAPVTPPPAANQPVPPQQPEKPAKKRRPVRTALMVVVPLVLAVGGGYFYLTGGRYEDTDNAYVQQAKVSLSADIAGRVTSVSVAENEVVKAGQTLFTLDPEPYRIALDQANAALASARVNVQQLKVSLGTANAMLKAAQSTLAIQQAAYDRQASLVKTAVASSATLDAPKLALQNAQNAVTTAQQQVAGATAALGGDPNIAIDKHPAVQAALAQVEAAQRNLNKTTVVAPADGIISQVSSLNVGQFVATGTTIASLVETGVTWVVANFKETQLGDIVVGMPAEVAVDTYGGQKLEGKVASIGAATGAEFSLIPAQNATGNWVKVVQRIPTRIEIASTGNLPVLRTGMSATVAVDTGKTTLDKLTHN